MEVFHDGFLLADDPMSAEQFHQEYNPPVEGSYTGMNKQEKIVPVTDPSNDREQVQQRFVCVSTAVLLCSAVYLIVHSIMESDWPRRNKSRYVTEIVSRLGFADVIFGGDKRQSEIRLHSQARVCFSTGSSHFSVLQTAASPGMQKKLLNSVDVVCLLQDRRFC